ncbi:MAG: hypothetical protein KAJ21_05475 [Thermoplasmatales archaeon]|nr:hypothetical protein [Thermoplasmatales archaeon]
MIINLFEENNYCAKPLVNYKHIISTFVALLLADYDVDKKIEGIREYFKEI